MKGGANGGGGSGTGTDNTDNSDGSNNANESNMTNNNSNSNTSVRKSGNRLPAPSDTNGTTDNPNTDDTSNNGAPQTFSQKAKAWVKEHPVKATVGGVLLAGGIVFGIVELHHHMKKKHKQPQQPALSGAPHKKKGRKKGKHKSKGKKQHKHPIALL